MLGGLLKERGLLCAKCDRSGFQPLCFLSDSVPRAMPWAGIVRAFGAGGAVEKQIPFGNDRQKCKCNGKSKGNSRFPLGKTDRKARATATENAGNFG